MRPKFIYQLAICAAVATSVHAQNDRREASITGGGSPDRGKCTIEVRVDSIAEVEVRRTTATLRTLGGQPAQWRRFECTAPMPANPVNFRFAGVDGRGRQTLVRDPQSGGVAVVRIEDKDNGSEGYTFDLFWGVGGDSRGNVYQDRNNQEGRNVQPIRPQVDVRIGGWHRDYPDDRYRPGWRDSEYYRRYGHGFAVDEAIRVCQNSIEQQALARFRGSDIHFGWTKIDDRPGNNDWVVGSVDIFRGGREERFGFACSVNFDTGRVRSAELDDRPTRR